MTVQQPDVRERELGGATLQFLGAAATVTGSMFLIRAHGTAVLVDCGLFQGLRELRDRNWTELPFDPASIDAVVLTHAHVDHCGLLPRLVAGGYRGPIYASTSTVDLAGIVLPDCGHLQEEDARYANRRGFSRHRPALPLYTEDDARRTLAQLWPVEFESAFEVGAGLTVELVPAGHILGSAVVRLQIAGGPRVVFSGDLGRQSHPFLVEPAPPGPADVIVVESTYGDRRHPAVDPTAELEAVIARTVHRGGSVLIPAFAVDRTEVLLHHLAELAERGGLPAELPVYVDSPMALSALHVYRAAFQRGGRDIRPLERLTTAGLDVPGLQEVQDAASSRMLNMPSRPSIIVSASGMGTGGRVVHHLAHMLPDVRHSVVLVGYQAEGTRGRLLLDGAHEVKMLGRYVPVRAEIVDLPALSVHADRDELLEWVAAAPSRPAAVYVVHGEPASSAALQRSIRDALDWTAVVPRYGEIVSLDPVH